MAGGGKLPEWAGGPWQGAAPGSAGRHAWLLPPLCSSTQVIGFPLVITLVSSGPPEQATCLPRLHMLPAIVPSGHAVMLLCSAQPRAERSSLARLCSSHLSGPWHLPLGRAPVP